MYVHTYIITYISAVFTEQRVQYVVLKWLPISPMETPTYEPGVNNTPNKRQKQGKLLERMGLHRTGSATSLFFSVKNKNKNKSGKSSQKPSPHFVTGLCGVWAVHVPSMLVV